MSTSAEPAPTASIGRRTFVKNLSVAGLGLALGVANVSGKAAADAAPPVRRRRFVIVGTGHRHEMYQNAIENDFKDTAELVGLCDSNPGRLKVAQELSVANSATIPAGYAPADLTECLPSSSPTP